MNFENKRLEAVQKDTIKLCTETNTQCIPSLIHQQHKLATVILCSFTALPTCFGSSLSGKLPSVDPWLSLCAICTSDFYKKPLKPPPHPVLCFWLLFIFLKALKLGIKPTATIFVVLHLAIKINGKAYCQVIAAAFFLPNGS